MTMIVDSIELTRPLPPALAERALIERQLQGVLQVSTLLRLIEDLADPQGEIRWQALFSCAPDGTRRLDLHAEVDLQLLCQRCLGAAQHSITVERVFHLVETEEEADQIFEADPESEIEPLAAGRKFDLATLLEDEIILALPVIRTHDEMNKGTCGPSPLKTKAKVGVVMEKKPSPFAALAALKKNSK